MSGRDTVGIGMIGGGFLAETRARCYARTSGVAARIVAVAARTEASARAYAERHGVPVWCRTVDELLARDDVDVVDLCVPNAAHRPLAEAAARAGKHVVCTKPLTAYVGQDLPTEDDSSVAAVDGQRMWDVALADARAMDEACAQHGVQLMYGENWVYAPSLTKAARLVEAAGGSILEMRGGECHSGSHSPFSKRWAATGGGALLRMGAHPIGAMLHLKHREGVVRGGNPIRPIAVTAEVGRLAAGGPQRSTWLVDDWVDVENWGALILTFDDGTRAVVHASDTVLGGMESRLELFLSNSHLRLNLSPNDLLQAFAPDAAVFGGEYIMEKVSSSAGWTTPIPDEDWTSGHQAMCQDFVDAVASGRPARADGALGVAVVDVVYAAYLAARTGRRVDIPRR
ncbi:MAG: Gfo/Idh/MocA family oxidoreductase [Planctomycetes bacterium]|nr:Gfo/Idh/MocA family oxidoreductase [Planctomycetota bacterium]